MGKNCGPAMEEECYDPILFYSSIFEGVEVDQEVEQEEEDFRSCCDEEEEEEDLEEKNEPIETCSKANNDIDDFSVRMYFKGISTAPIVDSDSGLSGIGVVMERPANSSPILVQKRIDFFVNESVANYLALMDGLIEAKQNKIIKVFAFTDSESLCDQINHNECLEDPLFIALRQRILEHTTELETFTLEFVSENDLQGALELAKVSVGLVSFPVKDDESIESCSICCEEKLASMMITMKCHHRFCSHCMKTYVEGKLESAQVPVRCPELRCVYCLTTSECKAFLPLSTYDKLEKALCEAKVIPSENIYCPHPSCSVLLDPSVCFSSSGSSSIHTENSCLECPVCQRLICVKCKVPWHASMTCKQYQNLPFDGINVTHDTLHHVCEKRWRRCPQCYRMLELSPAFCHMTCWCGHEFCFSCGAEYRNGDQTCQCSFCKEDDSVYAEDDLTQACKQWAWDSYDSLPLTMDAYSDQERSQQALINRFLAGNFSLSDEIDYQSSPSCRDTCVDAMKDLHELPWLESFVSLIDDTYHQEYL